MSIEAPCPPTAITRTLRRVRQTRDFRPDPISEETLLDLLNVARWTGSITNTQPWSFIVVTDAQTKRRMAEAAPNTPHIGIAPVVIVVVKEPKGIETDHFDEGRLAERIMIAARAHGLDSGIGRARGDAQAEIGRILDVPEDVTVRTMVSVGYATEEGARPKAKPGTARRPLETFIHRDRFG